MPRAKRLGGFNALSDHAIGTATPLWPWLERPTPPPHPVPVRRMNNRSRRIGLNALDDLLPGPEEQADARAAESPRRKPRSRRTAGHNALDELLPGPVALAEAPARPRQRARQQARVVLTLPADVAAAAEDAVAFLADAPDPLTLDALATEALRREVDRLAAQHNAGRPFPPRDQ